MKHIKIINLSLIILSIILLSIIIFFGNINTLLLKSTIITFYSSLIVSGLIILNTYTPTLKRKTIIGIQSYVVFLILFALTIFFSESFFDKTWNILTTLTLVYILIIQLNILNWSGKSHTFLNKILFLLSLVSNIFLASIFLFKIDFYELKTSIISSFIISFSVFIIGLLTPNNKAN